MRDESESVDSVDIVGLCFTRFYEVRRRSDRVLIQCGVQENCLLNGLRILLAASVPC